MKRDKARVINRSHSYYTHLFIDYLFLVTDSLRRRR